MIGPCFSVIWLVHVLIWLVVVVAVIAVLRVLVPWALGGMSMPIAQVINIVMTAIILIAILFFVIDLLTCARIVT